MNESKLKHLEFIQAVITRMNTNSFLIKGSMVTLVSALFALAAKDSHPRYVLITYVAIFVFWPLDAFYLSQEKQYRGLYDAVRNRESTDFSMDAKPYRVAKNTWRSVLFSRTILGLYGPMAVIVLLVMFVLSARI